MPDPHGKKAGIISKPYGLEGKVILILNQGAGKKIKAGNPLFISIDGQRVPFIIKQAEPGSQNQLIIQFEFIDSLDEARKVCGCEAYEDLTTPPDSIDNLTAYDRLSGYTAMDIKVGLIGTITGYMPHDYNPVFMVERAKAEILIPANDQLIDHIDHRSNTIFFRLPDGLIDL
jgi:16S rRNA processing protein RimM